MLPIPQSILHKANNVLATQPMLVAAIFAENGASDSLSTYYRMSGAKDPASAADVNIQTLPETGELTLATGINIAALENTTPLAVGFASEWRAVVSDNFGWQGHGYFYDPTYVHSSYSVSVLSNQPPISLRFTAQGTCSVDTLRIQLGQAAAPARTTARSDAFIAPLKLAVANAQAAFNTWNKAYLKLRTAYNIKMFNAAKLALDNAVARLNAGYSPRNANLGTLCYIRIVDVLNNKQVGNAVSLALPAGAPYLTRVFKGFAAGLVRSRVYALEISYSVPDNGTLGYEQCVDANYYIKIVVGGFAVGAIPTLWQIPILGGCIPLGGRTGFQAAGIAYRSLDVCINGAVAPVTNGVFSYSDLLAAGTDMTVDAYASNDPALYAAAGLLGWNVIGRLQSGEVVPPYRYWRFKIALRSTQQADDTPRMVSMTVAYAGEPIILGTHAQEVTFPGIFNTYRSTAVKAINTVSSSTATLEPKAKTVMVGKLTLELAPEPEVEQLFSHPLRGKRVVVRAGYADAPDTLLYYDGLVRDLAFQGGRYILTIQDPIELADISVPRTRWPAWMAATAYASGVTVSHIDKSYLSLTAKNGTQLNQGLAPDLNPTFWQPAGNVWKDIGYLNGTHLCDAAADILQNQINLATEKIDLLSLERVKSQYPARISSGRNIGNPEKAIDILSDLAWLTESFWVMREGRLALIAEASASDVPVEFITPDDIKEGLQYRRGWAELKNECLIFTNYLGAGNGSEQFLNAIAVADAQSVGDYNIAAVQEFNDKWNVPTAELTTLAGSFVQRWKNGRRIVRVDASMRLLSIECGDVALLKSAQLPVGDKSQLKGITIQKDLDWMAQSIQLTFMEV